MLESLKNANNERYGRNPKGCIYPSMCTVCLQSKPNFLIIPSRLQLV